MCRTMNMFPRNRLSDLFGKTLRATSFEYAPYTYIVGKIDGEPIYDGVEASLKNYKYYGYMFVIDILKPKCFEPFFSGKPIYETTANKNFR